MSRGYYTLKAGILVLALATAGINSGLETSRITHQIADAHVAKVVIESVYCTTASGVAGIAHALRDLFA